MPHNMKSVMIFNPKDAEEQTANKFIEWIRNNKSAVADKYVANAEETRKYLAGLSK